MRRVLDAIPSFEAVPERDLPFVDAVAVVVALVLAYGARAATNATYPLAWDGVAPPVREALPVCLATFLLSAAALGLYGRGARGTDALRVLAAVSYCTAAVAVVGTWWGGEFPPTLVLLPGAVFLFAAAYAGRRLYWRSQARARATAA